MGPKILISSSRTYPHAAEYTHALLRAGARHAVAVYSPGPAWARQYDGLLLTGGGDIEPSLFGQENTASTLIDLRRDQAEIPLIREFARLGKPILGICRGHQVLNVAFGGDLIQDLPTAARHASGTKEYLLHETQTAPGSILAGLFGETIRTNSYHHQGVGRIGADLHPTQWSENGAVIEALEHDALPIFSVQWHPERMTGDFLRTDEGAPDTLPLFRHFVHLCEGSHV
jgi:putative glutamine amidotransferase